MIRKLRFRLVLASMLSLLAVLGVIVGGLNALNYQRVVREADGILALLAQNGGAFPAMDENFEWPAPGPDYRSPELPFEKRYFWVLLDADGAALESDTRRITAVDDAAAQALAAGVFGGGRSGFDGIYRYLCAQEPDGGARVIFLDCGRELAQFHMLLRRSAAICAVVLAAVFLLILLLSGRIVRPILRSYEAQKRFISDAGHELRTPITIIDADAELIEMEHGDSEWLADIRQQTARLTDLTGDLIFLSRMEAPEPGTMIEFPLSDAVGETAASFQALALTRGKTFEMDVEPMLSMTGDARQIRQLVSILLDNAMKYSDEHGRIKLSLRRQGRSIRLEVENSVESVAPGLLDNMFERFWRGDPSRNSAVKGYGIGLSVARAVTAAHKGRIAVAAPDPHTLRITASFPS